MVKDGIVWVIVPLVLAVLAGAFGLWWLAAVFLLLSAFMAYFFRDPHREIPKEESLVVSPADGRVTRVEKLTTDDESSPTVVSIFLSPLDVHVNRAPIAGKVVDVTYTKGRFRMATREDASLVNEQNSLTIQGERMTVVCKQIAGVLARRIVCWKKAGDSLAIGERFGLIKFGSRTDLILPPGVELKVKVGDRVSGGVSVIGRLNDGSESSL